jgi:hypothetical protein
MYCELFRRWYRNSRISDAECVPTHSLGNRTGYKWLLLASDIELELEERSRSSSCSSVGSVKNGQELIEPQTYYHNLCFSTKQLLTCNKKLSIIVQRGPFVNKVLTTRMHLECRR